MSVVVVRTGIVPFFTQNYKDSPIAQKLSAIPDSYLPAKLTLFALKILKIDENNCHYPQVLFWSASLSGLETALNVLLPK